MKLLHKISIGEYNDGRDLSAEVDDIIEKTEDTDGESTKSVLYVARFLVPGSIAVEGLVGVHGIYTDDTVGFQLADDFGELDRTFNRAPISEKGIVGSIILRDVRVLRVQEGYFHAFGSALDVLNAVPEYAHLTRSSASSDYMRGNLAA